MPTFEDALKTIEEKGAGIHKIHGDFYAFGEAWDTICVEEACENIEDEDEFIDCAYDYAVDMTYNKIPQELKEMGFEVIEIKHIEFDGDDVPYGWSVALLKKKG